MNGIGNAFIWTAIACGPLFMLIIGIMAIVPARKRRRAAPAPARIGAPRRGGGGAAGV